MANTMPKRVTRKSIISKLSTYAVDLGPIKAVLVYIQKMNHPKADQFRNQARESIADAILLSPAIS